MFTTYDKESVNIHYENCVGLDSEDYKKKYPKVDFVKDLGSEFVRRSKNIVLTEKSSTQEVIHNSIYLDIFNNGGWVKSENIDDIIRVIREKYYKKYHIPKRHQQKIRDVCCQYFHDGNIKAKTSNVVYEQPILVGFLVVPTSMYLVICVEYI